MKNIALSIFILLLSFQILAQNWSEPVNVSNMEGFNQDSDFCYDNSGAIHCVWIHVYELNYSKVFYSKSCDDGITWSIAQNISFNNEKRISQPHIVCDSENNLHLTYDYDVGNYYESLVYYKKYNGTNWSEAVIVSESMPGSRANKLVIDHNDRIYCVWFLDINNGTALYRYLENSEWSSIFIPYDNNDYLAFVSCAIDTNNNLHWIGAHHYEGQNHYEDKPIYFFYNYETDLWSDFIEFGEFYSWYGFDIDIDLSENPHIVWHEFTNNSTPPNDGTFYAHYDGANWSAPSLVVEDPKNQQLIIDDYNKTNIFDTEKYDTGNKLLFYYYSNNIWNGFVIDETPNAFFFLKVKKRDNKLHLFYTKSMMIEEGQIFFSEMDMIVGVNDIDASFLSFTFCPNPFNQFLFIKIDLLHKEKVSAKIYSIQGKLVNTLINENKSPGKYEIIWDGKDKNGKEVNSGLYLIRLQLGRNIQTRSVEIVK